MRRNRLIGINAIHRAATVFLCAALAVTLCFAAAPKAYAAETGGGAPGAEASQGGAVTALAGNSAPKVKITFDANGGYVSNKIKTVRYGDKYGAFPEAARSGYHLLGWYRVYGGEFAYWSSFETKKSDRVYSGPKQTLKARWVKAGKGATVTAAEWRRILSNIQYGLEYSDVKAIVGGAGKPQGYGAVNAVGVYYFGNRYVWNSSTPNVQILMVFDRTTKRLATYDFIYSIQ